MSVPQLRTVTYLCPSIPVELLQALLEILEEFTGLHPTLLYEWRTNGPANDKSDPFKTNLVDLAFMSSSGYINLESSKNEFAELLPVTPIFKHPKNKLGIAGTFVDIIVHADKLKHNVTGLSDLRGCRWACTEKNSLANYVTVSTLKELGENMSFFGMSHNVGSHIDSINMVLNKKVEAAAIDSAALICNKSLLHDGAKDVVTLTSYGPFSPYAVVINTRLDANLKEKIIEAFLSMTDSNPKLKKFGLVKFVANNNDAYNAEKQLFSNVSSKLGGIPYY